jgi:hypothetical protein
MRLEGLLLAFSVVAVVLLFIGLLSVRTRYTTEWRCVWRGRQLRLVSLTHLKELWVDGAVVADQVTRDDIDVDLVTEVDGTMVLGRIRHHGPTACSGRFYVDGVWIGGDPPEPGDRTQPLPAGPPTDSEHAISPL